MRFNFADCVATNIQHLHGCRKRGTRGYLVNRYPNTEPYWELVYCGTPIVRAFPEFDTVILFHNGFKTPTTKRRMNHALGRGRHASHGEAPCSTRYHLFQHQLQWYVRDEISMTTAHWKGGRHFIISPKYNVGYEVDRIPSGWLYQE